MNIWSGSYDREYLLYIPESYSEDNPADLIVCLHGFNRTMNDFFNDYNISAIADSLNLIVLAPQALAEKDPDVIKEAEKLKSYGIDIPLNAAWGCGLQVKATLLSFITILDEELNKNVDDVSFIEAIIYETLDKYHINNQNKFIFGTSLGGFMSYQYALNKGDDLSGLISICGSMGTKIKNQEINVKVPICDFHSIDDEVVPYNGSLSLNIPGINIILCQEKENVINTWIIKNNALPSPKIEEINHYPSENNYTITKYTYPEALNEVIHYKIRGASHSYYFKKENGDRMDYNEEIYKFITDHTQKNETGTGKKSARSQLEIYPNPVTGQYIHLNIDKGTAAIYELSGKKIFSGSIENGTLYTGFLTKGIYLIRIISSGENLYSKIVVY
jgi:poly(3-hydroxybutyrate) depolymerase